MDSLEQVAYSWIPEYLSQRFEPVIVEVADYVEANVDGVVVQVWRPSPEDPNFSGSVAAQFPEGEEADPVLVWLDVSCRREIHMAALKDGFQMVCRSEFTRLLDDGTRVDELTLSEGPRLDLPVGPQAAFGFDDTAAVRQRLDQWADATVMYIRENRELLLDALEAGRARSKSIQAEPK
jgi:hypothetical protein